MIKPVGRNILVLPDNVEKMSEGKHGAPIELPQVTQENRRIVMVRGTVLSMGPFAFDTEGENWCEVGDRILYAKYGGWEQEDEEDGQRYRVIMDSDVVAVLTTRTQERRRKKAEIMRAYSMELDGAQAALDRLGLDEEWRIMGSADMIPDMYADDWNGEKFDHKWDVHELLQHLMVTELPVEHGTDEPGVISSDIEDDEPLQSAAQA